MTRLSVQCKRFTHFYRSQSIIWVFFRRNSLFLSEKIFAMMKFLLSLTCGVLMFAAHSQTASADYSAYVGKYEVNGFVVQVLIKEHTLSLAVQGAPIQPLILIE